MFWFVGGTAPEKYDQAMRDGTFEQLPGPHSPFWAPDAETTIKTGIMAMVADVFLAFALMWSLKEGGLALANTLSSTLNASALLIALRQRLGPVGHGQERGLEPLQPSEQRARLLGDPARHPVGSQGSPVPLREQPEEALGPVPESLDLGSHLSDPL